MPKLSDRFRILSSLSVVMLTAFIFISVVNYHVSRRYIREEIVNSALPLLRENILSEIHEDLMLPTQVASVMANDTFLRDWALGGEHNAEAVIQYLKKIHDEYGFFSTFFISHLSGTYYHHTGVFKKMNPDSPQDAWYYSFLESGLSMRLEVDSDELSPDSLTVFVNFCAYDQQDHALGVTGVGLRLESLAQLFASYQQLLGRTAYLVDTRGTVQVHPEQSKVRHATLASLSSEGTAERVLRERIKPVDVMYEGVEDDGFLTARYIPEVDWFLVVQQTEDEAMTSARRNLLRTAVVGGMVTLAVLLVSLFTLRRFQAQLERQAVTDTLTGLPNRRSLEQKFTTLHSLLYRNGSSFSMAALDLNGFKDINDTYGHLTGDVLLQAFGRVVQSLLRASDTLSRWGGDEFILLISGSEETAALLIKRIRDRLAREPLARVDGVDIFISTSCGLTEVRRNDTLDSAYVRADKAMYADKAIYDRAKV